MLADIPKKLLKSEYEARDERHCKVWRVVRPSLPTSPHPFFFQFQLRHNMPVLQGDITNSPVRPAVALTLPGERGLSVSPPDFSDDLDSSSSPSFLSSTPSNSRKRQGEDLTQIVREAGRSLKLRKSTQSELSAMITVSGLRRLCHWLFLKNVLT